MQRTTNGPLTDHGPQQRAPEWSSDGPPLRGGQRTTTRTTAQVGQGVVAGCLDTLTAADVIAATAPARLSNFEQATFATMIELREIDAEMERLDTRKAELRADLLKALASSDEKSATFADLGTASIASGPIKVVVVDAYLVPDRFAKIERVIDTTAAGKALRAGGEVPGLRLSLAGADVLRVAWAKPEPVAA